MYRYNKTSIILKITIAILFITSLVIECSCERSDEPKKESTGFITYTLRWDSVIPGFPAPEKLRYCIYPSEGGPMIQTDGDANSMMLFLPPATYKILVFNYDAKNIDFRNMSRFDEAEAYILQTKATGQASQGITPLVWVCRRFIGDHTGARQVGHFGTDSVGPPRNLYGTGRQTGGDKDLQRFIIGRIHLIKLE